eukprot:c15611_g1_i4.p1 GENE.c15611_g1_i4~~c15611_g1_i4.p1  ORF type:complete len:183 (+),score=27.99 c15611_g1_i4:52-600(+)
MDNDFLPNEIIPRLLYLGSKGAREDPIVFESLGIRGVVDLSCLELPQFPGVEYLKVLVQDSREANISSWFSVTSTFITEHIEKNQAVLVHCNQGISRSSAIVIAFLMTRLGFSLQGAFKHTKTRRRIILPNPHFIRQLVALERQLHPDWETPSLELGVYDEFKFHPVPNTHADPDVQLFQFT